MLRFDDLTFTTSSKAKSGLLADNHCFIKEIEVPSKFVIDNYYDEDEGIEIDRNQLPGHFDYSPDSFQIIDELASSLDSELMEVLSNQLLKKRTNPQDEVDRLRLLDAFLLPDQATCDLNITSTNFSYNAAARTLMVQETIEGRPVQLPVVRGSPTEILKFVMDNYRGKYHEIVSMLGMTMGSRKFREDWQEALNEYRQLRKTSRSLDLFTKVSQCEEIDAGHHATQYNVEDYGTATWFTEDGEEQPPFPLQVLGGVYESGVEGDLILGDVVVGDSDGSVSNDYRKLRDLWKKAEGGRVVRVRVYMEKNISPTFKGYIVTKGRPHNLVMTVELDPDGPPLRELFALWISLIERHNIWRNEFYLDKNKNVPMRKHHEYTNRTWQRVNRNIAFSPIATKSLYKEKNEPPDEKQMRIRQEKLAALCDDPRSLNKCKAEHWPSLGTVRFCKGPIKWQDFGYGTAEMVFGSCVRYAESRGWKTCFTNGQWCLF